MQGVVVQIAVAGEYLLWVESGHALRCVALGSFEEDSAFEFAPSCEGFLCGEPRFVSLWDLEAACILQSTLRACCQRSRTGIKESGSSLQSRIILGSERKGEDFNVKGVNAETAQHRQDTFETSVQNMHCVSCHGQISCSILVALDSVALAKVKEAPFGGSLYSFNPLEGDILLFY